MDTKKRGSSLRKTMLSRGDDEHTVASCTPRIKRRISFSGKHLVREFHHEEEPRTWDNSYEISDNLNADETGTNGDENAAQSIEKNTFRPNESTKQNTYLSEPHHNENDCVNATRDLINIPFQNTLCIENSVDITLFENEKQYCAKQKRLQSFLNLPDVSITSDNSFSLDENEILTLPVSRSKVFGERTIDYIKDLKRESFNNLSDEANWKERPIGQIHNRTEDCEGVTVYNELMDEADYVKFTCSESNSRKDAITIYMNDSLSNSNIESSKKKIIGDKRKTMKRAVGMDFSPDKPIDLDKENIYQSISLEKNVTINNSCVMDIERMFEMPNSSSNIEMESKEFEEKLDRISFVKKYDCTHMEDRQFQRKYVDAKVRPTINFNQLIESSPDKPEPSNMRKSIKLYENMTVSPVKISSDIKHVNIPENLRKDCEPIKLIVRKICTPLSGNSKNLMELEKLRSQRYKMKQEQNDLSYDLISTPASSLDVHVPMPDNSLNFSVNSVNISLSPESSSSLLIPPEYKAYNCKQLNDEIERGKIQLFTKTPTTDRKTKKYSQFNNNTSPELAKQRRTLFFEDDIEITPKIKSSKDFKHSESNNSFDFNTTRGDSQCGKNVKCRFSQADDLMLDNTSFLARAKLGDETTSGNSTKIDISLLNDLENIEKISAFQLYNAVMDPKTEINTNFSSHSMFKDALSSIRDTCIDLRKNDSHTKKCETTLKRKSSLSNTNYKNRDTIHLNEDIDMSHNGITESDDMKLGEVRGETTVVSLKESSIYHHNDMELNDVKNSPFNAYSSSSERRTIYENRDMELDVEIREIAPTTPIEIGDVFRTCATKHTLNINLKEDIAASCKKRITRDGHTKHFEHDKLQMNETAQDESCVDINCAVNKPIENINTEIHVKNKPANSGTIHEPQDTLIDKNHSIKNNSNVQGVNVIPVDHEMENTCCIQSNIDHKHHSVENPQMDLEITEMDEYLEENTSYYKENSKESFGSRSRRTLYFNQCIEADNLKKQSVDISEEYMKDSKKNVKSRLTLLNHHDMDLDQSNRDEKLLFKNESMKMECASDQYHASVGTTLYFNDDVEMDLCESIQKLGEGKQDPSNCTEANVIAKYSENALKPKPRKTVYFNDDVHDMENCIVNNSKNIFTKAYIKSDGNLHTQNFCADISSEEHDMLPKYEREGTEEIEVQLDQIYEKNIIHGHPDDKEENDVCSDRFPETVLPDSNHDLLKSVSLVGGKFLLSRQRHTNNVLASKCLLTPMKGSLIGERLCDMTPRPSLTEFLAYEKRTKQSSEVKIEKDVNLEERQYKSPEHNDISIKRLPINLTPLLSMAKKRHMLIFTNCDIDESMDNDNILEINEEKSDEMHTNNQKDASLFVFNTPIQQTSTNLRKSRIPVPLNSGKKTNSNISNMNISELSRSNEIFEDIENLIQSIQEIRRATTYAHPIDTTISQYENQRTSQHLLFEDNPITISDVSVYYQAQKKSVVDICDKTTCIATEETKGKSFQKRYMNFTCDSALDVIDQTRLSLVRTLSDEDIDEGQKELNGMSNVRTEPMCRKCKRCQETFLNETMSSMTDSFVLPALPPVPTLVFNRLRRLRRRPHISDVNMLWQRASLDRTMINLNNQFGDRSLFPNKCVDDDCSAVMQPIQRYLNSVQSCKIAAEKHLNGCPVMPSLITRLNDITRLQLPNWILDCQLQNKGVVFFSHRTIITFSLVLTYEETDPLGVEIQLKNVKIDKCRIPMKNWKPIDFILDFQLKLNLPFDLIALCERSDELGILKMMQKIDQVCTETTQMGIQLQHIVFFHRSSIIREQHRTFVRKIVRRVEEDPEKYNRIEKMEFRIELLNVKKLCFKDITLPPLYNFCEDIHLLPVGLQFLNEFLEKPLGYLKNF